MYALIEFAGKQYNVEEGNSIKVPYIDEKVGSKVTIDKILYLDDGKNKIIGTPFVNEVKILGEIETHGRERKVVVFKFKRRKGYQKKNTHRQKYTILKISKLVSAKKSSSTKKTVDKNEAVKKAALKTAVKKTNKKKTTAKKSTEQKKKKV